MAELSILVFFVLAIVAALVALETRDLLAAIMVLSLFSFLVALLYVALGAVDVGFNEAVLGAGVTGVLFVVTIFHTRRGAEEAAGGRTRLLAIPLLVACGLVFLGVAPGLPAFGDPLAPAATHVSDHYVEHAYEDSHTENIVTVMIADYRSFDTLGEGIVVFTAGLACFLLLRESTRRAPEGEDPTR